MYRAISFHILVVYRPPYSTSHPVTSSVFFEEFSAFIEQFLNEHQSVLICGDFNIPCNKPEDLDSIALDELCDNMGLDQLVKCQTHKFGNTLDLIMVPRDGKLIYSEPEEKFQISDHSFIHVCISMPKPKVVRDLRKFRDIKNINSVDFTRDLGQFNTDSAKLENIDELSKSYNCELLKILDKHAPEKEKVTIIRPTLPWFTSETSSLKAICRKMERRWRANKNKESEHIYKSVRHVYRKHLRYNKHKYINSAIQGCGQDMSKMYKFMFTLLGKSKDNPMPPSDSDALLADEFASFFMEKIVKIRKDLEQFDLYDPHM